jgi:putative DNA methylase
VARVREQLKARKGGTADARLTCVISERPGENGAQNRPPKSEDDSPLEMVKRRLGTLGSSNGHVLSAVPSEPYPDETASGALSASVLYGFRTWGDLFAPRQSVALASFSRLVKRVPTQINDPNVAEATVTCLAFCVSKLADYLSSRCAWRTARSCAAHTFVRQALPMTWDFAEMSPFAGSSGDWSEAVRYLGLFIEANVIPSEGHGTIEQSSATKHPLPDDIAQLLATDPAYYDAIAYGDLSDYFYVWRVESQNAVVDPVSGGVKKKSPDVL